MIRKIICFIVLFAILGLLATCNLKTVNRASSGSSSELPKETTSQTSSIVPLVTPTSATSTVSSDILSEAPENTPVVINGEMSSVIPTNPSVNFAWGGYMCEAGGNVYYVSDDGKGKHSPVHIVRVSADQSQGIAVTSEYASIYGLTADDNNLYFAAAIYMEDADSLYALPLNGGVEKKLCDWKFSAPQVAGGRLYWENNSDPGLKDNITTIMCINPDGTNAQTLLSIPNPYCKPFYFLATPNGLYYSCRVGPAKDDNALFHTDLQGKNKKQLNREKLGDIDLLFYDQNNLYFTTLNYDNGDGMYTTVNCLDKNGLKSVVIKRIDYFPQDEGIIAFFGVSANILYYFNFDNSNGGKTVMDLHSFDIERKQDKIIAKVDYEYPSEIHSILGKTIHVYSSQGLYIVGNDLYYSFYKMQ
jgi:hypothetical protein